MLGQTSDYSTYVSTDPPVPQYYHSVAAPYSYGSLSRTLHPMDKAYALTPGLWYGPAGVEVPVSCGPRQYKETESLGLVGTSGSGDEVGIWYLRS